MTEQWITSHLPIQFDGEVTLITYENGNTQSIDPTTLSTVTSTVSDPPTYAALSALSISSAGWQPIWDDWKARGIVS